MNKIRPSGGEEEASYLVWNKQISTWQLKEMMKWIRLRQHYDYDDRNGKDLNSRGKLTPRSRYRQKTQSPGGGVCVYPKNV
jgi:hypothetical protein